MASSDGTIVLTTKIDESGITKGISAIKSGAGKLGKTFAVAGAAATAAFAGISTAAVKGYADYEQLTGGVETLFKTSSDAVMQYANQAYQTAGLSANQYMETVTSFSASLLQSLGGDTAKAAEAGNQAVIDMSDNANKMGTDIQRIQDAYQGFAKQNFTMLDNLKLGYGGTKTEMERLLAEAEKIKAANGEMASYSIDSFADITEAIHVVQTEMGITGTTAEEAATTIQGSVGMMRAAWENLMTGIADENADIDDLMQKFADSVETVFDNLAPVVEKTLDSLPKLVTTLGTKVIQAVPGAFNKIAPKVLDSVAKLIKSIIATLSKNAKTIGSTVATMVGQAITAIIQLIPQMVSAGVQLIGGLIQGMQSQYPALTTAVMTIGAIFAALKVVEIVQGIVSGFRAIQAALTAYTAACAASQSVSGLLAATMTPLQLAIDVLTGKVTLAAAAQAVWNAVMNLNPAILIATAVIGLTAAVGGCVSAYDSYVAKHSEAVIASQNMAAASEEAAKKAQELNDSVASFRDSAESAIIDAEAQAAADSALADELYELVKQENLSVEQKRRMKTIVDGLNGSVDGLNLKWDENAGALNMSREALQEYIDKSEEMAKAEAIHELQVETLKAQYKAQIDNTAATNKLSEAEKRLNELEEQGTTRLIKLGKHRTVVTKYTAEQEQEIENLNKVIEEENKRIEENNKTIDEAGQILQVLSSETEGTAQAMSDAAQSTDAVAANVGTDIPAAFGAASGAAENSSKKVTKSVEETFKTVNGTVSAENANAPTLGGDWGQGYANGIEGKNQVVYTAAYNLARMANLGTKDGQDSNSPSKEAKKLGVDFDDGYVLGIEGGYEDAEKAGELLAQHTLIGAKKGAKDVKKYISETLSELTADTRSEVSKLYDEWDTEKFENLLPSEQEYQDAVGLLGIARASRELKRQYKDIETTRDEAFRTAEEQYNKAIAKAKSDAERAETEAERAEAKAKAEEDYKKSIAKLEQEQEDARIEFEEDQEIERLKIAATREREIYEARLKDLENLKTRIIDVYDEMTEGVIADIDELQKTQETFATKLSNYGAVFAEKSYYNLDGTEKKYKTLANLNSQTQTLQRYYDTLTAVKERGDVPKEFFETLRDMSVDEGLEYATMLMNLSDRKFEDYISSWSNKQSVSEKISKDLFADDALELANGIRAEFDAASGVFTPIGEDAAELFNSGFLSEFGRSFDNIKKAISSSFSQVLPDNLFGVSDALFDVNSASFPAIVAGAVTPSNSSFWENVILANDGDQQLLSSIEEEVRKMSASNNGNPTQVVVLEVDGRELGRTVLHEVGRENVRLGTSILK